jgi:biotin carboxyl carrier protein
MPGKVVRVLVTVGQNVQAGEGIVVVEAMKMENELRTPRAGVVSQVSARPGLSVEVGAVLAVVD